MLPRERFPSKSQAHHGNIAVEKNAKFSAAKPCSWVETGESVSKLYSEAREEARELALARNAYFTQVS